MPRRTTVALLLFALSMVPCFCGLIAAQDIPDFNQAIDARVYEPPKVFAAEVCEEPDVDAIFYEALPYKGRHTRVFAYLGVPVSDKGEKLPAMVLVHGGGGTAFAEWVRIWNERGYAAIAMDLEGHLPLGKVGRRQGHEHSGPSRAGIFADADLPIREQWMYHAVSDIMLAHSLLASLDAVDADRIGTTGISWGGVLTSLVAGVDSRLKCVAPVYGCGFLYDSKGNFQSMRSPDPVVFAQRKIWDPAHYFVNATMPILWVNGDEDGHFSVDTTSRSHQAVTSPSTLSIHPGMGHGHKPGYDPNTVPEIYAFADSLLKEGIPLARITQHPAGRKAVMRYESERPIAHAEVRYLTEPLRYESVKVFLSQWKQLDADLDAKSGTVTVELPEQTTLYYINLTDDRGCIVSSEVCDLR